jgi:hypothetical protein
MERSRFSEEQIIAVLQEQEAGVLPARPAEHEFPGGELESTAPSAFNNVARCASAAGTCSWQSFEVEIAICGSGRGALLRLDGHRRVAPRWPGLCLSN